MISPKKFIKETKNKYPLTLKFENFTLNVYDVVLGKDIIYFYFETDNTETISLDTIYKDKKFPVFADGKQDKPKCNDFVPSVQECSLLPTGFNYSTKIEINGQSLMVALDTGSTPLGVPTDPYVQLKPTNPYGNPLPTYKPAHDKCFKTTDYLTYIQYGTGSWGGSNVISKLEVGSKKLDFMQFSAAYFDPNTESPIYQGGILGLAFTDLNQRINFNKKSYPPTPEMLTQQFWDEENKKPKTVYPTFMDYYGQKYTIYSQKFAFYVKRIVVSSYNDEEEAKKDLTNYGKFILGGGEELTNLYEGDLSVIQVIKIPPTQSFPGFDYKVYTIQLNSFKIEDNSILVPDNIFTIIDSGTTALILPNYFYEHIKIIFTSIKIPLNCDGTGNFWDKYTFEYISTTTNLVDKEDVCLKYWPTLYLPLTDTNGNEKIFTISPKNYWNITDNKYYFYILFGSPHIILGHPFLCENYTVFDYGQKQVKIAPRK
jgi:hypothetical protein